MRALEVSTSEMGIITFWPEGVVPSVITGPPTSAKLLRTVEVCRVDARIGADSLRLVSLLLVIEQKFGVNLMKIGLKPDDMKSVATLAAAVKAGQQG